MTPHERTREIQRLVSCVDWPRVQSYDERKRAEATMAQIAGQLHEMAVALAPLGVEMIVAIADDGQKVLRTV